MPNAIPTMRLLPPEDEEELRRQQEAAAAPVVPKIARGVSSPTVRPVNLPKIGEQQQQLDADSAELTRLKSTGSGISQVSNPIGRGILRGLETAAAILAPRVAAAIPGTELHHEQLVNNAEKRVESDTGIIKDQAETNKIVNPPKPPISDPFDAWYQGKQAKGEPIDISEFYKLEQDAKAPKVANPEQQAFDDFRKQGLPPAEAYRKVKEAGVVDRPDEFERLFMAEHGRKPTLKDRIAYQREVSPKTFVMPSETPPKPPSGQEQGALGYYQRAKQADEDLAALEDDITKMGTVATAWNQNAPNFLVSKEGQEINRAQRSFTEARLRKESGAAIPPQEYENDRQTYFPMPGDKPETLIQKAKARKIVLESLRIGAGRAYAQYYNTDRPNVDNAPSTEVKQKFNVTKWKEKNPSGDVNKAIEAAKAKGYEVTQ